MNELIKSRFFEITGLLLLTTVIFTGCYFQKNSISKKELRMENIKLFRQYLQKKRTPKSISMPKGRDVLNVRDFGAKGDGLTDDLPAFDKALNEINRRRRNIVLYIPGGLYFLGESLKKYPGTDDHVTLTDNGENYPHLNKSLLRLVCII